MLRRPSEQEMTTAPRWPGALLGALILVGLYLTTHVNYLLFHSLVELFSVVVAFCVFLVAWNSRAYIQSPYLLFVGMAYFFIALLDLLHTLAYKGMPIFTDYDYYANQLWIAARFMESISLVLGFAFLRLRRPLNPVPVFLAYSLASALLVASIFYWRVFPECFVAGAGLTLFKKVSEYVICALLLLAGVLLRQNRPSFDGRVYRLILASIGCTIVSELAFTFYISNYGFSNLVGHYFKLFSFYAIYRALLETGLKEPFQLIFRELDETNQKLEREVELRKSSQQEQQELIANLRTALDEIKTLQGIIPICSHCKKIRDDEGSWNQLEAYISSHSDAQFTHGICPDCMSKLYPDFVKKG